MKQLSRGIYAKKDFVYKYSNALKVDKFHKYEDKPAMHKLLGDIRGKSVLCAGCGNGNECAYMKKKGAKYVVGIDLSESMIELAKRLHKGIEFHAMSFAKMDLPDSKFDIVYSDLVIHYMSNRFPAMSESYRVLKPGGRLIFSDTHPIYEMLERRKRGNLKEALFGYIRKGDKYEVIGNYFAGKIRRSEWFKGYSVKSYRVTLSDIIMPAIRAGFILKNIMEPRPSKALKKVDPEFYKRLDRVPQALILEFYKPK